MVYSICCIRDVRLARSYVLWKYNFLLCLSLSKLGERRTSGNKSTNMRKDKWYHVMSHASHIQFAKSNPLTYYWHRFLLHYNAWLACSIVYCDGLLYFIPTHFYFPCFFPLIVNYSLWINRLANFEREHKIFDRPFIRVESHALKLHICTWNIARIYEKLCRANLTTQNKNKNRATTTTSTTTTITRNVNREIGRLKLKSIINQGVWKAIRMDTLTVYAHTFSRTHPDDTKHFTTISLTSQIWR